MVSDVNPVPTKSGVSYDRLMLTPTYRWWRPAFGAMVIVCGWLVATIIAVAPAQALNPDPEGVVSWSTLLATNLSLAALVPICLIVYSRLHRLPAGLLSSVQPGVRWRPLLMFAGIALAADLALLAFALLMSVDLASEINGPASDAAAVIAVALLTSPLQAAGEEYLFRGYLLQGLGAIVRNPWVAIVLTSVLFTMAHGVWPWESPALFADRFAFGLVAGWLVLRTGGLEAGIAMHAVNNVVTFVFAALTDSVSDSLQAADAPVGLVVVDVIKFVAFGAAAVWLARRHKLRTEPDPALLVEPARPAPGLPPGVPPGQRLV